MSFSIYFLHENLNMVKDFLRLKIPIEKINDELEEKTNINHFFRSEAELHEFRDYLLGLLNKKKKEKKSKQDLGDFQTPIDFTNKICQYLQNQNCNPEILLEPTCGEGNFIISALKIFSNLKKIYCVDLQPKYEWNFKLNIINLRSEQEFQAEIHFYRLNIFSSDFSEIFRKL